MDPRAEQTNRGGPPRRVGSVVALLLVGLLLAFLSWLTSRNDEAPVPPVRSASKEPASPDDGAPAADSVEPTGPVLEEALDEEHAVDEMSEQELEAACMAGRRAACDLLGH